MANRDALTDDTPGIRRYRHRRSGGIIAYWHLAPVVAMLGGMVLLNPQVDKAVRESPRAVLGVSMTLSRAALEGALAADRSEQAVDLIDATADDEYGVALALALGEDEYDATLDFDWDRKNGAVFASVSPSWNDTIVFAAAIAPAEHLADGADDGSETALAFDPFRDLYATPHEPSSAPSIPASLAATPAALNPPTAQGWSYTTFPPPGVNQRPAPRPGASSGSVYAANASAYEAGRR